MQTDLEPTSYPPSDEILLVRRTEEVLWLTINRPEKRNALSFKILEGIKNAIETAAEADVRAVVLGAAGDSAFAAGGDLPELSKFRSAHQAEEMSMNARSTLKAIREATVPVIAAVNGLAIGGGAELAIACDFRVFGPTGKIGFVQAKLNVSTAWGGGLYLVDLVGPQKALTALTTSRIFSDVEARHFGLADAICENGESLNLRLEKFMAPILKIKPQVFTAFKAIARSHSLPEEQRQKVELSHLVSTWTHEDHWDVADLAVKPMLPVNEKETQTKV